MLGLWTRLRPTCAGGAPDPIRSTAAVTVKSPGIQARPGPIGQPHIMVTLTRNDTDWGALEYSRWVGGCWTWTTSPGSSTTKPGPCVIGWPGTAQVVVTTRCADCRPPSGP